MTAKILSNSHISNINFGPPAPDISNKKEKQSILHLIECTCILPQYLTAKKPIFHKFVVFSILDENDNLIKKIVQCNNCGIIHKVTDICKSEIIYGKEDSGSILTKDDIKLGLSQSLIKLLSDYEVDLYVWEHAKFILDNKLWGRHIILTNEQFDEQRSGKFLVINGRDKFGISTYEEQI